jgi:hypothetical protein
MVSRERTITVRTLRNILLSILFAALAFLAAWILTVNFDVTVHSFEHQDVARRAAFRLGFLIAAAASAVVFLVALFRLESRRVRNKPRA